MLFAALTVGLTAILAQRFWGRKAAILSGFLLLTTPLFVRHAQNAVPDMAFNFLSFLHVFLAQGNGLWPIGYGLVLISALLVIIRGSIVSVDAGIAHSIFSRGLFAGSFVGAGGIGGTRDVAAVCREDSRKNQARRRCCRCQSRYP